jgi:molecular chaperone HtpG
VTTANFQVNLRGVVELLAHHLYSSPRVHLRELMQNAVDATTARRRLDLAAPPARVDRSYLDLLDRAGGAGHTPAEERP